MCELPRRPVSGCERGHGVHGLHDRELLSYGRISAAAVPGRQLHKQHGPRGGKRLHTMPTRRVMCHQLDGADALRARHL